MPKTAVLFNGLRFPFAVIDNSFECANKENGDLLAIFLLARDAEPEGYIFPSDIDEAENMSDAADSKADNEKLVESNIQMLKHRAIADNINFQSVVLRDPSEQTLSETLKDSDYIFVSKDINELSIATIDSLDLKGFLSKFAGTVRII